jgi:putative membrane protein
MPFLMNDRENALEVLKKRYAKGEIGKEEYERIKKDIQ